MFGNIIYISDTMAHVKLLPNSKIAANLMNVHVVFEDGNSRILGEISDIDGEKIKVNFLGEFDGNKFNSGILRKPTLSSRLRLINKEELAIIIGADKKEGNLFIGKSVLYNGYPICVSTNDLFSNHMAIFGNTGSGKSCGVARIMQNLFSNPNFIPYNANFLFFDSYGEYHSAFKDLNKLNPNYNFKFFGTNSNLEANKQIRIPLWLLNMDDFALILDATKHSQLQIIERMLQIVNVFSGDQEQAKRYKNHLIAKAIMDILYTNQTAASKRNDVFDLIATCNTKEFSLETQVQGVGYTRSFRNCFMIDTKGNFPELNLLTEYVTGFIDDEYDKLENKLPGYYTLEDLENALNFTLISEGMLRNESLYDDAILLKVRMHSLVNGDYNRFFRYPEYVTLENYVASLVATETGKAQIINFNLDEVDDSFAKVLTKIFSRLLFVYAKKLENRASIPFHIVLEESHRYVQADTDRFLLGYNIFERIAKEGRKYGIILDLISQRPVELSETVLSQCSNFLIFKMTHPRDIEYISKMLPNISADIIEKQKSLQPGTCVAFGRSFKVPMIIKLDMPSPEPQSGNCDVVDRWQVRN